MNRSIKALRSRGVEANLATRLVFEEDYTLSKLAQLPKAELETLGLTSSAIREIHSERPPIPDDILDRILFEARWTCCVCRSSTEIIVHHIDEWANSRSHAPENLAVLCISCHNKAHQTGGHTTNLTVDRLRAAKEAWTVAVQTLDVTSVVGARWLLNPMWDYFNHRRIAEACVARGMDISTAPRFEELVKSGFVSTSGRLLWEPTEDERRRNPCVYLVDAHAADRIQEYYETLLRRLLDFGPVFDLESLSATTGAGQIVVVGGRFRFKRQDKRKNTGPGQIRTATLTGTEWKLEVVFDAWETLSASAHDGHLSRTSSVTAVLLARGCHAKELTATVLGFGFGTPDRAHDFA